MGRKVAYKGNTLIAQAQIRLTAQPQMRLVAYGRGLHMPPVPDGYYFVVDFEGNYVLDFEEKFVIAKNE